MQFRAEGGLHLLFEPEAMDKWIPRKIATSEGGAYVDNETRRQTMKGACNASLIVSGQGNKQTA